MLTGLIAFGLVNVATAWDELAGLAEKHYAELAHWPDLPFSLDRKRYVLLQDVGALRVFGVRDGETLVGYSSYVITESLHQSYCLTARHDALYLLPEYRNRHLGMDLIKHCDAALKAEGVRVVFMSSHIRQPIHHLLARSGYEQVDIDYAKRLDR